MSKLAKALTAAAGNAAGESLYVEDVFSTYLYAGNGAYQTITNGIDLLNEGGLVWAKSRTTSNRDNYWWDTERGYTSGDTNFSGHTLSSNTTSAEQSGEHVRNIYEDGYQSWGGYHINMTGQDYASWTFRKAEKFFDVVTYTGNGTTQTLNHNINGDVGCIIMKRLDNGGSWYVWHKEFDNLYAFPAYLRLDATNSATGDGVDFITNVTSNSFDVGPGYAWNQSGANYVVYVFASDAGGFGDDGSENIIKCGSYTGNGSTDGPEIDCGFEPQWLLIKNTSNGGNWVLMDAMRGMPVGDEATVLLPNASGAESSYANLWGVDLQANGFKVNVSQIQINESGGTMVYIAIRRPMKTPESGTEVFAATTQQATYPNWVTGFPVDWMFYKNIDNASGDWFTGSRLIGTDRGRLNTTDAFSASSLMQWDYMNGQGEWSTSADSTAYTWNFKRATGFFDVVAYSGDGQTTQTLNHNLGAEPELIIIKSRSSVQHWAVYSKPVGNSNTLLLSGTFAALAGDEWGYTTPTSGVFTIGQATKVNQTNQSFIAYLFATLAGVSKVGSYTGTGSNVDVDCGFSAGARFILIKRTDSTGDWYVWDSERGIVAGNDPYLLLNSTAAEVTSTDYIDPLSSGFTVTSSAPAALNASGGTYIFLAIA